MPEKLAVWGNCLGSLHCPQPDAALQSRILPAYSPDGRRATSGNIMDIFLAARKQYPKRKSTSRTHTTSVFKRLLSKVPSPPSGDSIKFGSSLSFVTMTPEAAYPSNRTLEPFSYSIYTPERFRSFSEQCPTCLRAAAKARLK